MRLSYLAYYLLLSMTSEYALAVDSIDFNTDVLDVKDQKNIDLKEFSRAGYVMPGEYTLAVHVNEANLQEENITFLKNRSNPELSEACLPRSLVERFGFTDTVLQHLEWWHEGQCLNTDSDSVKGMTATAELASSTLLITIPQAYLEYSSPTWDPPSRWDDGVAGVLSDYNASFMKVQSEGDSASSSSLSGNGTLGANAGAWRIRADWQASRNQYGAGNTRQQWQWSRYYLYRTIRSLRARMVVGEDYLDSDLFDNPRFAGVRIVSDDSQLPPNLRGYAPEVTGVARTHAKVTVSQQGRVIYESQVAPGPFRIQSLSDSTRGSLDVLITEQDGTQQSFQVNTASVPYLSRPGMVRYKVATGRPDDLRHHVNGPLFSTGEFSWGVSNGWSLYGGGLFADDYQSVSGGTGRDLMAFGAVSVDMSAAHTQLPKENSITGNSYRVSYSKTFDSLDSQVTFAGYRFSERTYMSLSDYLDAREDGIRPVGSKQMYTASLNKAFRGIGLSSYLNISRQTYWGNTPPDIRYSLSMAKFFDIGMFKNISMSLSAYRSAYRNTKDRGGYLSVSVPTGDNNTITWSASKANGDLQQTASYFSTVDDHNSYEVTAGSGRSGTTGNASWSHQGDAADIDSSAGWQEGNYISGSVTVRGGMTATTHGAALHRIGHTGGTRLMLSTDGISEVPVHGYGSTTDTNTFGVAVLGDVSSYYHNEARIDIDHLPDNVSAVNSEAAATLTEGAIGYRRFDVLAGKQSIVVIGLKNGGMAPFGAIVKNIHGQQTGLVGDAGSTWLIGMNPGERMDVEWDGKTQCSFLLPEHLNMSTLLLPCDNAEVLPFSKA